MPCSERSRSHRSVTPDARRHRSTPDSRFSVTSDRLETHENKDDSHTGQCPVSSPDRTPASLRRDACPVYDAPTASGKGRDLPHHTNRVRRHVAVDRAQFVRRQARSLNDGERLVDRTAVCVDNEREGLSRLFNDPREQGAYIVTNRVLVRSVRCCRLRFLRANEIARTPVAGDRPELEVLWQPRHFCQRAVDRSILLRLGAQLGRTCRRRQQPSGICGQSNGEEPAHEANVTRCLTAPHDSTSLRLPAPRDRASTPSSSAATRAALSQSTDGAGFTERTGVPYCAFRRSRGLRR